LHRYAAGAVPKSAANSVPVKLSAVHPENIPIVPKPSPIKAFGFDNFSTRRL
jgi:hypothetical protein